MGIKLIDASANRKNRECPVESLRPSLNRPVPALPITTFVAMLAAMASAAAGADGTVKLWDPATGQERASLKGHKSWINGVAFAPGGGLLATASSDGTLKLWDVAAASEKATIDANAGEVRSVAFAPDGKT